MGPIVYQAAGQKPPLRAKRRNKRMPPQYNRIMRTRCPALLVLFALAVAATAAAQTPRKKSSGGKKATAQTTELQPPSWKIEALAVEGNHNYTAAQILAASGLGVGQAVTKQDFDRARDRLIATGAFENAGYRYEPSQTSTGYTVTLQVQEAQPVYPYMFEDLPANPKEMEAALRQSDLLFGPKIPATETLLKRYCAALEQYLAAKGYQDGVTARVSLENINDLMVVFRPATPPVTVAEVRFTGANVIPTVELQRAIHGIAIGSIYQESRFRQFLETTIRPLYEQRGRLRVAFPKLTTAPAPDVKGVIVTVQVSEGESYTLGDVNIEGAAGRVKFKTGEVADMLAAQDGVDQVLQQVRRLGYMKATALVERKLDDAKRVVNLKVRVTPGPQYTFGELTIQGLDINGEAAMRRMWGLQPGKPFDAGYPDFFLGRVRQEGMFDSLGDTKSLVKVNEDARTADVTLVFQGARPPARRQRP